MPEWSKGAVSKTVVAIAVTVGSNPTLSAITPVFLVFGEMTEWSKVHDWKSCVGQPPTEGSNPSLSAIFILGWGSSSVGRALGSQSGGRGFDSHLLHQYLSVNEVVLDGEIAVPCTRNPL